MPSVCFSVQIVLNLCYAGWKVHNTSEWKFQHWQVDQHSCYFLLNTSHLWTSMSEVGIFSFVLFRWIGGSFATFFISNSVQGKNTFPHMIMYIILLLLLSFHFITTLEYSKDFLMPVMHLEATQIFSCTLQFTEMCFRITCANNQTIYT